MHDADRSAVLSAIKQQLNRFEHLGMEKEAALSVHEYLARLAAAGMIDACTASDAATLYDRCRFGKGSLAPEEAGRAIAALHAAAEVLEAMEESARAALVVSLHRPAPNAQRRTLPVSRVAPASSSLRREASAAVREAAQLASRRKRRAERGPSRLWTFIACGLVLWTLAVMAGSLWQHERIERMLASSDWGRPLMSRIRGERREQSALRRRVESDKRSATARDFARLGDQYLVRREYADSVHAFRQGLARESTDELKADMLNSLAWMFLTADQAWYRDSLQAQQLAERAVELDQTPEIFDTLAVAYSQNGHLDKAAEMEARALELAQKRPEWFGDQRYYRHQLNEFERAADAASKAALAGP